MTELGADFENYVLVKHRGDGSGNPEQLRVINKNTGEDKWLGNYPFYLDKENEVGVYKAYTDSSSQIVVHDFLTDETETYPHQTLNVYAADVLKLLNLTMIVSQ
jgi:hypothetical protein